MQTKLPCFTEARFPRGLDDFDRVDGIISSVCGVCKVTEDQITGRSRVERIVIARTISVYLSRCKTQLTLHDLARRFKNDHSAIHHMIGRVPSWLESWQQFRRAFKEVSARVG